MFSKNPVGFWANTETIKVKDVKDYNRASGLLFIIYGIIFVILGIPLLEGQKKLVPKLRQFIQKQRKTSFPLLIFASEIKRGQEFAEILQSTFPNEKVGFVASTTENRLEIVEKFRQKEITILVTTTILERGVTFPCVDVFVVEANHRLFSRSALVQIAGRVGRSMDRPTGELIFFHDGSTMAIEKAIKEIQEMNQEAGL